MHKTSTTPYIKITLFNIGLVTLIIISLLYIINTPSDSSAIQISDADIKNYKGFAFRENSSKVKPIKTNLELILKPNENLSEILLRANLEKNEVEKIINSIKRKYDLKKIHVGKKISLNLLNSKDNIHNNATNEAKKYSKLVDLKFKIDHNKLLTVKKHNEKFIANIENIVLTVKHSRISNIIEKSFSESLSKHNFSRQAIKELTQAFSYDLDFQKDLRKGDLLELLYEKLYDDEGNFAKIGNIIYASLKLANGKKYNLFRFQTKDRDSIYLSEDGKDIKKDLLKTPLNKIKVSSKFGMRVHPIYGCKKMHTGIDLAAKLGTPVFSAGTGIIVDIAFKPGYGKYLKIDHGKNWATAYAHLGKFGPGIKKGDRVTQGQLIGFVGTTGSVTAPHLHYETLYNNVQVNPLNIKISKREILSKAEMTKFRQYKKQIIANLNSVQSRTEAVLAPAKPLIVGKK